MTRFCCISINAKKNLVQPSLEKLFPSPTKHRHAFSVPLELDFMGEIKRRVFGWEVCSRGLALPVKDVGRGYIFMLKGVLRRLG